MTCKGIHIIGATHDIKITDNFVSNYIMDRTEIVIQETPDPWHKSDLYKWGQRKIGKEPTK